MPKWYAYVCTLFSFMLYDTMLTPVLERQLN